MKRIIFLSIVAFSLVLQASPDSMIEEPEERKQQDIGMSDQKQEVLSHKTIQALIPEQSALERDLVERLEKARKSGDRETARTLLSELDAMHGIITLPAKTSKTSFVVSGEEVVANNMEPLQMLSGDIRVNSISHNVLNPSMISTPEGILFVAMENQDTGKLSIYRSDNNGNNWRHILLLTENGFMNPSSAYQVDPNDGVGYVYIAYESNSNSDGTNRAVGVFRFAVANHSNYDFSTVDSGITMNGANDHIAPEIISDYEYDPSFPFLHITYSKYAIDYYPVYHSKSTNHGSNWSTPTNITGGAENSSWPGHPDIAFSGSRVHVAFNKLGHGQNGLKTQVWVVTGSGYGSDWSTSPVQLTDYPDRAISPRIEADPWHGSIMVGWLYDRYDSGSDHNIYCDYSTDNGTNWNYGGPISAILGNNDNAFELAHSDSKFHVVYHMFDHKLMYENIAITDIGNSAKWTDPVQADDKSGYVSYAFPWPAITVPPNSNEKACFAWTDYRNDTSSPYTYDIYFNRNTTIEFLPAVIMYLLN